MICPACGASAWSLVEHEGVAYLLQAIDQERGEVSGIPVGYGLVVEPHVCNNCGFVRLHAVRDTTSDSPSYFAKPS